MDTFLIAAGVSFGLAALLTPRFRALAIRLRLVDHPDGRRKLHGRSTPVAGGPILLSAVGAAVLLAICLHPRTPSPIDVTANHLAGLFLACLVICGVGIADDLGRLRGRHKLLGQVLAIAVVIAFGVRIEAMHLFGVDLPLGPLALPFTAFFLLGAINSLNLLDGMDGLLTSVALLICVFFGSIALLAGREITACTALSLAAALLAFLWFNFPPATIFLGDSGSMLIGLAIGVLAIESSLKRPATVALATPAALLTLPIFDTLAAILRRKLTGRSIYSTDRGHLHHCLLRRFSSPHRVLLIVCTCCLATGLGALAGEMLECEVLILLSSGAVVAALIATRLFGHAELRLVAQRLGTLLRLRRPGEAHEIELHLQGTVDWRELWLRITDSAPSLNLSRMRLGVNAPAWGEGYHARWDCGHNGSDDGEGRWHALLPVAMQGCLIGELSITGRHDEEPIENKIARLSRILREFEVRAFPSAAGGVALSSALPQTPLPPTRLAVPRAEADLQQAQP